MDVNANIGHITTCNRLFSLPPLLFFFFLASWRVPNASLKLDSICRIQIHASASVSGIRKDLATVCAAATWASGVTRFICRTFPLCPRSVATATRHGTPSLVWQRANGHRAPSPPRQCRARARPQQPQPQPPTVRAARPPGTQARSPARAASAAMTATPAGKRPARQGPRSAPLRSAASSASPARSVCPSDRPPGE
jgi:hypothetical protein